MKKVLLFLTLALTALALASCEKDPQPGSYARGTTIEITNDSEYDVLFTITFLNNARDRIEFTVEPKSHVEYDWETLAEDYGVSPMSGVYVSVKTVDSNQVQNTIWDRGVEFISYFRYTFTIYWDGKRCDFTDSRPTH